MDNTKRKRGFATLSPAQRIAVSRKGGSKKVKKGFAIMENEEHLEASRKGGKAKRDNKKEQNG